MRLGGKSIIQTVQYPFNLESIFILWEKLTDTTCIKSKQCYYGYFFRGFIDVQVNVT